jgi:glutathione S-transferase
MKLYTCGQAKSGGSLPFPLRHPCGGAAHALDEAGHSYELVKVPGYRMLPWTRRGDERTEIRQLSGQDNVPILQLDDGEVISGSGRIIAWAKDHPAA